MCDIPEQFDNDSLRVAFLYTEGVRLSAQRGNNAALPYLKEALGIDSLHAPTNFQLASILMEGGNPQQVLKHSNIAYRSDTTNIDYLSQVAYAEVMAGNYGTAKKYYNRLLRVDSKNPYNYRALAALYAGTGMPYTAISVLDSAEYKLGHIKELAEQKHGLLMDVKLYDRAKSEASSVLSNHPYDFDSHRNIADVYATTGEDSLAQVHYEKSLSLAPTNPTTLFAATHFYRTRGNEKRYLELLQQVFISDMVPLDHKLSAYDEATSNIEFYKRNYYSISTLTSLLHIKHPDDFRTTERYASHQLRSGEIDKAFGAYKNFAKREDAPIQALYFVIDAESFLGNTDSVDLYIDRTIERFPTLADPHLIKAYELQDRGPQHHKEVVAEFNKAVKLSGSPEEKSVVFGSLGDYYYSLGQHKKAFRTYAKAIEENPDNAAVLNNWAYFICELVESEVLGLKTAQNDLEQALEMATRAVELSPSNPTYLDSKAWILHLLGRSAEAKPLLKQAISLDSSADETLLWHYADVLAALNETFMAEIYYKRALEAGADKELIESRLAKLNEK